MSSCLPKVPLCLSETWAAGAQRGFLDLFRCRVSDLGKAEWENEKTEGANRGLCYSSPSTYIRFMSG